METSLMRVNREPQLEIIDLNPEVGNLSSSISFIEANTVSVPFTQIRQEHIIPVYVKDNEPLISQSDFILLTLEAVSNIFIGEQVNSPVIRCSHPIKGRIPEAKDKPANQLQEWEKTLYYERMMFVIELPTIMETIDGNPLTLTVGGVKAYSLDNLYNRKGAAEHFKLFIGFKNKVCTNLCVSTDGYLADLRVSSLNQLQAGIHRLIESYNLSFHLNQLQSLTNYSITEQQFAQLVGRCRMYPYLPTNKRKEIPVLLFGDSQLTAVCKDYYKDNSFSRQEDGNLNLWRLYNLFTGANKTTYIDQFLDRSVNALNFISGIRQAVSDANKNWFLS